MFMLRTLWRVLPERRQDVYGSMKHGVGGCLLCRTLTPNVGDQVLGREEIDRQGGGGWSLSITSQREHFEHFQGSSLAFAPCLSDSVEHLPTLRFSTRSLQSVSKVVCRNPLTTAETTTSL